MSAASGKKTEWGLKKGEREVYVVGYRTSPVGRLVRDPKPYVSLASAVDAAVLWKSRAAGLDPKGSPVSRTFEIAHVRMKIEVLEVFEQNARGEFIALA